MPAHNLIVKQLLRWQILVAIDIAIEAVLILLSFFLVWKLQMEWQKKAIVVLGFAFRLPQVSLSNRLSADTDQRQANCNCTPPPPLCHRRHQLFKSVIRPNSSKYLQGSPTRLGVDFSYHPMPPNFRLEPRNRVPGRHPF